MLYRKIQSLIEEHLKSNSKDILIVDGARQVGKTFIIRHIGNKLYKNYIEVNMIEDSIGDRLFADIRTVDDFYLQLSMIHGDKMGEKDDTIVFIDEIQASPQLLTLLKFHLKIIGLPILLAVHFWESPFHRQHLFQWAVFAGFACFPLTLKNSCMQME